MTGSSNLSELVENLDKVQASANAAVASGNIPNTSPWTQDLVLFLASSILLFTFGALLIAAILLWRHKPQGSQILHVLGVITILGVSAFLLVVGYSNEQLTPIVGLFGAIAGYLLGKDSNQAECKSDEIIEIKRELEALKRQYEDRNNRE